MAKAKAKAKAATTYYEERVNTTFIGYFVMAIFLLMIGIMGLQEGNLFGDDYTKWPLSIWVFADICGVIGVIFLVLTVLAYRTGEKTSTAFFAISAFLGFVMYYNWWDGGSDNIDWFIFIVMAIMFVILALYSILEEDARLISLLFLVFAVMFVFVALAFFFCPDTTWVPGPGSDENLFHAMSVVYGVIAIIAFVLTTYLGLAHSQPDKLPLI